MKVLHIINSLRIGGAEKLIVDSLGLYSQFDVEVDLLLLNSDQTPFLEKLKKTYKGNVFISKIKNCYSPLQILEIKKYLRKEYEIIHVHLFPSLYWVALAKFIFRTKSKLVFTEHNTGNRRLNNYWFRKIDKIIYSIYVRVIAITPQVKDELIEKLKLKEEKIEVIYNGIDIIKFQKSSPYSKGFFFRGDKKILIQVSRFEIQKNQKTLIKSLSLLPEEYVLLLVGEGEMKKENIELCQKLGVADRVKFLGIRMDVPELLKTADIVVQSSHWEGFGLVAIEGMASGKPVVVSAVSGLKELVENYGLLFKKEDENDLVKKILSLRDIEYYEEIANKCSKRALDFQLNFMVKNYIQVYKNVLDL
ncbi:glycosyltransferase [Flavobacterium oreochromis]